MNRQKLFRGKKTIMSMDSSAMNSLQSTYANISDDEDLPEKTGTGVDDISDDEHETGSLVRRQEILSSIPSHMFDTKTPTPKSVPSEDKVSPASIKRTCLVSYQNEEDEEDEDEEEGEGVSEEHAVTEVVDEDSNSKSQPETKSSALFACSSYSGNNQLQLPPSPPGQCDHRLQKKIIKMLELSKQGRDMNAEIQNRKDFRNPSIYEKLIEMLNIDEKGTNFPPDIYDPHMWSKESYYDELEKIQKRELEKREKEKKERTKIEFVTGTKRPTSVDAQSLGSEPKRKTKWDTQPAPGIAMMRPPIGSAGVVNNITLTTTASGTKSTIIPATGSIAKKSSSSR